MRDEVLAEIRTRLAWNLKHDKIAVGIGIIKLVNVLWIAGLWQRGFPTIPLVLWIGFFLISMGVCFKIEERQNRARIGDDGADIH